jgi:hypothetical protein
MDNIRSFYQTESDNGRRTIDHYERRCQERGWEPEALAVVWDIPLRWYHEYTPHNVDWDKYSSISGNVRDRTYEKGEVFSMCYVIEFRYYDDAVVYKLSKQFDNDVTLVDGR